MVEVALSYEADPYVQELLSKLLLDASSVLNFSVVNGLLRYKSRIWVGNDLALQQKLLTTFHSSPLGGHFGISVTYRRLKQMFAWRGMKSAVHSFVQSCLICSR
jgi:hypothetical protein